MWRIFAATTHWSNSLAGLVQCSKESVGVVQELAELLRRLKAGNHKALIFTQMARMLDILEVSCSDRMHTQSY